MIKDWCGICGGDNSTCKEEKGVYNRTVYGYNTVVRIPSGKLKKHFTWERYFVIKNTILYMLIRKLKSYFMNT